MGLWLYYLRNATNIYVIIKKYSPPFRKKKNSNKNNKKNLFNKNESVVKTQKGCEQGWDGTNTRG